MNNFEEFYLQLYMYYKPNKSSVWCKYNKIDCKSLFDGKNKEEYISLFNDIRINFKFMPNLKELNDRYNPKEEKVSKDSGVYESTSEEWQWYKGNVIGGDGLKSERNRAFWKLQAEVLLATRGQVLNFDFVLKYIAEHNLFDRYDFFLKIEMDK